MANAVVVIDYCVCIAGSGSEPSNKMDERV